MTEWLESSGATPPNPLTNLPEESNLYLNTPVRDPEMNSG